MVLIGICMTGSIQREKFTVVADYVNLVKNMDYQQLEIDEKNQEYIY